MIKLYWQRLLANLKLNKAPIQDHSGIQTANRRRFLEKLYKKNK